MAAGVVAVGAFAAGATAVVMYMTAVTGGAVGAAGAVGVAAATGQAATGTGAALVHATDVASAFVSSMLTSHKKSDDEEEGH
ncbi:hypothetical protein LSAT2_018183 [Lamellibrachia satsuma]|nr:hypothetical protein LSAT2_018183 [Lamellibrachia satsuma]